MACNVFSTSKAHRMCVAMVQVQEGSADKPAGMARKDLETSAIASASSTDKPSDEPTSPSWALPCDVLEPRAPGMPTDCDLPSSLVWKNLGTTASESASSAEKPAVMLTPPSEASPLDMLEIRAPDMPTDRDQPASVVWKNPETIASASASSAEKPALELTPPSEATEQANKSGGTLATTQSILESAEKSHIFIKDEHHRCRALLFASYAIVRSGSNGKQGWQP